MSPYFRSIKFFAEFTIFASPYFEHDAYMHRALHVLDAPVMGRVCTIVC